MAAVSLSTGPAYGSTANLGHRKAVITAAENNNLKATPGFVGKVIVWDVGTTATLDIYDHGSTNTNKVWGWVSANGIGSFELCIPMQIGIRVVTGGTPGAWTIVYE